MLPDHAPSQSELGDCPTGGDDSGDDMLFLAESIRDRIEDGGDNVWQAMTGGYITYSGELDCNLNGLPDACDIANGTSEDSNGTGIPDECDSTCVGDVDGDGDTDVNDVLMIINGFGDAYNVDDLLTTIAAVGCQG